jgi:hypothetical protein
VAVTHKALQKHHSNIQLAQLFKENKNFLRLVAENQSI